MRTSRVTLTIVAVMGLAARAQQGGDPCAPGSFNARACKRAISVAGYCSGGTWIGTTYHEQYPYYYDLYRQWVATGGEVVPGDDCGYPTSHFASAANGHSVARGGFGGCHGGGHS